jgi:hypothetical protein
MSTVTVPRSNVTVEEVCAVLRNALGSRYGVTPSMTSRGFAKEVPGDANTLLISGSWFQRANIRISPGADHTEINVSPGATYPGLIRLIDRIGIARTVYQILEHAPELAGSR